MERDRVYSIGSRKSMESVTNGSVVDRTAGLDKRKLSGQKSIQVQRNINKASDCFIGPIDLVPPDLISKDQCPVPGFKINAAPDSIDTVMYVIIVNVELEAQIVGLVEQRCCVPRLEIHVRWSANQLPINIMWSSEEVTIVIEVQV